MHLARQHRRQLDGPEQEGTGRVGRGTHGKSSPFPSSPGRSQSDQQEQGLSDPRGLHPNTAHHEPDRADGMGGPGSLVHGSTAPVHNQVVLMGGSGRMALNVRGVSQVQSRDSDHERHATADSGDSGCQEESPRHSSVKIISGD